jgi:gliding motility-associated-like protein
MARAFVFAVTLLIGVAGYAQEDLVESSLGRFGIEFDKGCAPFTVNIHILDDFGDITRQYIYTGSPNDISNETTFTYSEPGNYEIIQVIGLDDVGSKTDTLSIEVVEATEPELIFEKCEVNGLFVRSADNFYDFTRVYFSESDSIELGPNQSGVYIFPIAGEKTIRTKGFFMNADEVCTDFSRNITLDPLPTPPTIVSTDLKEICKDEFNLNVVIDQFDSLIQYQIAFEQTSEELLFEGFLDQSTLNFTSFDFDRTLGDYCVKISRINSCLNEINEENQLCSASSTISLTPFESTSSRYLINEVQIDLDSVSSGFYQIYRRTETEDFVFRSESTNTFRDPIGSNSRKYFYRIDYIDSCDQVLSSILTNPILIEAESIATNRYLIDYILPSPLELGTYELNFITGSEDDLSSREVIIDFNGEQNTGSFEISLNPKDGIRRQVLHATARDANGIAFSRSNTLTLKYELEIYVPKAFTPNNDGLNDTLEVFGLPTDVEVITRIYNRWGQQLYSSTDPENGWDGTINGKLAPEGTYVYEISFQTSDGENINQKGTFVLLKN